MCVCVCVSVCVCVCVCVWDREREREQRRKRETIRTSQSLQRWFNYRVRIWFTSLLWKEVWNWQGDEVPILWWLSLRSEGEAKRHFQESEIIVNMFLLCLHFKNAANNGQQNVVRLMRKLFCQFEIFQSNATKMVVFQLSERHNFRFQRSRALRFTSSPVFHT